MNNTRRKAIKKVIINLSTLKSQLEDILYEEQDCYDNMPENLLCSERAETSEEAIDALNDANDSLEEIIDRLEEII